MVVSHSRLFLRHMTACQPMSLTSTKSTSIAPLRYLSTEPKPIKSPPKPSKGAGFFSRLSSFLVGAGLTALGTQYLIHQEIVEGNKVILEKQKAIEKRLAALETKK